MMEKPQRSATAADPLVGEEMLRIADHDPTLWNVITLEYISGLIFRGYRKSLKFADLLPLSRKYTADFCVDRFEQYWKCAPENFHLCDEGLNKDSGVSKNRRSGSRSDWDVLCCLLRAFWPFVALTTCEELVFGCLRLLPALILARVISFVSGDEPASTGFLYGGLLLLAGLCTATLGNHEMLDMTCGGLQLKSALSAAVYKKTLVLSSGAVRKHNMGDITNLLSVDTDNIVQFCSHSAILWGGAIRVISSMFLIWNYLGPSCLVGLGVLAVSSPFSAVLWTRMVALQLKQLGIKGGRLQLLSEIFGGIKVFKLYAWEDPMKSMVEYMRASEASAIRKYLFSKCLINLIWNCIPFFVTATTFAAYILSSEANVLTPERAFVSLSLFNNMRWCMLMMPHAMAYLLQAKVSVGRIMRVLLGEELRSDSVTSCRNAENCIEIDSADLSWERSKLTLRSLQIHVKRGELVAVIGRVGSGKSSLVSAILGEMYLENGRVAKQCSVAYVPQQAWIQNATIRKNITFLKDYDMQRYHRIIGKCCLKKDFALFSSGDQTQIGDKGVNLSGGQRQRISLARAVYHDADLYLLDDPLSAVDAHVATDLFENVIGPQGLLRKKTRVLVTHSIAVLPYVDRVVLMDEGRISRVGTFHDLCRDGTFLRSLTTTEKHEKQSDAEESSENFQRQLVTGSPNGPEVVTLERRPTLSSVDSRIEDDQLIKEEAFEEGKVLWTIYINILLKFGVLSMLLVVLSYIGYRAFDVGSSIYLAKWTKIQNPSFDITASHLTNYLLFGAGQGVSIGLGSLVLAIGCLQAASRLHNAMLYRVLRAPMSFFDSTPLGRLLNRFGKDVDQLDLELWTNMDALMEYSLQVTAVVGLIAFYTPLFLAGFLPVACLYICLQKIYLKSSRQLRRLLAVSRSPVLNNFTETVSGASSIRAYGAQDFYLQRCFHRLDLQQNCFLLGQVALRWTSIRMDALGAVINCVVTLLIVYFRKDLGPEVSALILTYSLSLCDTLNWMARAAGEMQNTVVSAERIQEYSTLTQEADVRTPADDHLPKSWPLEGQVTLKDYATRYRPGLDEVIRGISLQIPAAHKVGIVGRTGAGKSSLTLALFRLLEASRGAMFIDGVDISSLGLLTLRSKLTIIPQEPVLFVGTIRTNLDPAGEYSDEELWAALARAHLKKFVSERLEGLQWTIDEGGTNMSVGQRQLMCLARALLRRSRVLILDEATAAVDPETDALIQAVIREDFSESTVITIAHRLHTILDAD
ncbi:multidrug resistance-associated protein 1-like, partial [Tropilaelaps mercedesae]